MHCTNRLLISISFLPCHHSTSPGCQWGQSEWHHQNTQWPSLQCQCSSCRTDLCRVWLICKQYIAINKYATQMHACFQFNQFLVWMESVYTCRHPQLLWMLSSSAWTSEAVASPCWWPVCENTRCFNALIHNWTKVSTGSVRRLTVQTSAASPPHLPPGGCTQEADGVWKPGN